MPIADCRLSSRTSAAHTKSAIDNQKSKIPWGAVA
jgi:hypothetical protein